LANQSLVLQEAQRSLAEKSQQPKETKLPDSSFLEAIKKVDPNLYELCKKKLEEGTSPKNNEDNDKKSEPHTGEVVMVSDGKEDQKEEAEDSSDTDESSESSNDSEETMKARDTNASTPIKDDARFTEQKTVEETTFHSITTLPVSNASDKVIDFINRGQQ